MIALLKAHWLLALLAAIGAWWFIRRRATPSGQRISGQMVTNPAAIAAVTAAAHDWPGGLGDPSKIVWADQAMYPGYLRNQYGAYYNPDTHQDFSPGSSPPVMAPSAYDSGEMVRPYIDPASIAQPAAEQATLKGGSDYNPVTAHAVIY